MSNSMVIEQGTHEQLLKRDGCYARLWKLQAQTFLPRNRPGFDVRQSWKEDIVVDLKRTV